MIVEFDKSFLKSLRKIKDSRVRVKLKQLLLKLESSQDLNQIPALKKLVGYERFYRIRIGSYRIGLEQLSDSTIKLIVILHRKDIYKRFP